ncbi:MAG: hypothetical protein KQH59_18175 [Desulfobulbaceae bacterium]|nr:hypothetical protein [Desulfobulbaceae bacterium]
MTAPSSSHLRFFKTTFSNTNTENGGPIIDSLAGLIANSAMNNVWDHVLSDDRLIGETKRRILGLKIHQDDTSGYLASARFGVEPTLGSDVVRAFAVTPGQYEDDAVPPARYYCGGVLVNPVTAGAQSFLLDVKSLLCVGDVQVGDKFWLTDKYTPGGTGNGEYVTVDTVAPTDTHLLIGTVELIANSYAAYNAETGQGGKGCSVLQHGTVQASFENFAQSRASGYDISTYPLILNNMGCRRDHITITFAAGGSDFSVVSERFGNLAAGVKGTDYSPMHPEWAKILFTLEGAGWDMGVTHQGGDTVEFDLNDAVAYVGEERIIPAACPPLSGNRVILLHTSEGL